MKHTLSLYKVKFNNTVRLDEFIKDEKKNIYDFKKCLDLQQIQVIKKMLQSLEYKEIPILDSPEQKNKKENPNYRKMIRLLFHAFSPLINQT